MVSIPLLTPSSVTYPDRPLFVIKNPLSSLSLSFATPLQTRSGDAVRQKLNVKHFDFKIVSAVKLLTDNRDQKTQLGYVPNTLVARKPEVVSISFLFGTCNHMVAEDAAASMFTW